MGMTKTRQCECGATVGSGMARHKRTAKHVDALDALDAQREQDQLAQAVACYLDRQSRAEHPDGHFDKAGRWYPGDDEYQPCCTGIRSPTRSYPYSLIVHCRSVGHVAALYDVDVAVLRRAVRSAAPATRLPAGAGWYKAVAVDADGTWRGLYDGRAYLPGCEEHEATRQDHGGGLYAYQSEAEARAAARDLPASWQEGLPRIVIEVSVGGSYCRYPNGKVAWSRLTPLRAVGVDAARRELVLAA